MNRSLFFLTPLSVHASKSFEIFFFTFFIYYFYVLFYYSLRRVNQSIIMLCKKEEHHFCVFAFDSLFVVSVGGMELVYLSKVTTSAALYVECECTRYRQEETLQLRNAKRDITWWW